ncbi:hypothetical protein HaLaN_09837 [Haematococcus lacustris]|uniref:Uncharacterized protein n=1 Tax=Haematococcus lacustris TaxID=44745 RepID=A0A699YXB1_HAELA|nr:hypothetical protein HaLaN_09837 [Haematococcus lacustris]
MFEPPAQPHQPASSNREYSCTCKTFNYMILDSHRNYWPHADHISTAMATVCPTIDLRCPCCLPIGGRDQTQHVEQGNVAMAYTPCVASQRGQVVGTTHEAVKQCSSLVCFRAWVEGRRYIGLACHRLLGHVGRGGRSRRGPHEQNWHELECQDLSRHSTQHSAQYLMLQAAPHS